MARTVRIEDGPANLNGVLAWLAEQECNEVLIEAGPKLIGSFIEAGLWDEWLAYVAPAAMGTQTLSIAEFAIGDMNDVVRGEMVDVQRIGPDMRVRMRRSVEES